MAGENSNRRRAIEAAREKDKLNSVRRKSIEQSKEVLAQSREDITQGQAALLGGASGVTFGISETRPELATTLGSIDLANAELLSGLLGDESKEGFETLQKLKDPEFVRQLRQKNFADIEAAKSEFPGTFLGTKAAGSIVSGVATTAPMIAAGPVAGGAAFATRTALGSIESGLRSAGESRAEPGSPQFIRDVGAGFALGAATMGLAETLGVIVRGGSALFKAAFRGEAGKRGTEVVTDTATAIANIQEKARLDKISKRQMEAGIANARAKADAKLLDEVRKSGRGIITKPILGSLEAGAKVVGGLTKRAVQGGQVQGLATSAGAPAVAAILPEPSAFLPGGP